MARKFEKHTGIQSRRISQVDEVELATQAINQLLGEQSITLDRCAAILLVTPSSIPAGTANRFLPRDRAREEQPTRMARHLADRLGMPGIKTYGMNGFCSGYAKALQFVRRKLRDSWQLPSEKYILVVTSNCISRITNFEDRASGALFGDFATATMITSCNSASIPPQFELVDARYERQESARSYFDFTNTTDVLYPSSDGGKTRAASRVVFSLDGMGIADTAPRAMANAATKMAAENDIDPSEVRHIVPHQAGAAIVRLTGMKLEEAGFTAEPCNGFTRDVGNTSSGSVPFALSELWDKLQGDILCPVAAVGAPGKPEVSQGCILLRRIQVGSIRKAA
ncbi:MAG: 3-oxoacyl-[acyl-carrier-protein] synthase III C-terminal domain-containing protein [Planctomycetota bacterium]